MPSFAWGKYTADSRPVGQGKQGFVYKGFDPEKNKKVAIKVTQNIEGARHEAAVMRSYGVHRHLVRYCDLFARDQDAYLVIEWVKGDSLKNSKRAYDEKSAVRITLNLLDAAARLHGSGYLHCDILPNNVMMVPGRPDTLKLIDFGIAVAKGPDGLYKGKHYRKKDTILCPPEQRLDDRWVLDDSSDLYRIAGICVFLMTKKKPALDRKTRAHRCKLKNKKLERVLNRAMHPDRGKRYRSAEDFIRALRPFAS